MKHLLTFILALTCATAIAQSVTVQADGPGDVMATGAGNVRGTATATFTDYFSGRFRVYATNNNIVVDLITGLSWLKDLTANETMHWHAAVEYCDLLVTNGYGDWRLPSMTNEGGTAELDALVSSNGLPTDGFAGVGLEGEPFLNNAPVVSWSSVTYSGDTNEAWGASTWNYYNFYNPKDSTLLRVTPCRGP